MLAILIDDDPIQRLVIKTWINKQFKSAVTVTDFDSASQALYYFTSLQIDSVLPDIVFLDLHMPKMSGWQFLDELKNKCSLVNYMQFYLWSCSERLDDHKKVKNYPLVKDFLTKPVEFKKVFTIISNCLHQQAHDAAD